MNELFVLLKEERDARVEMETKLEQIIENAIEKNAVQNGHVSAASIKQILQDHRQECKDDMNTIVKQVDDKLTIFINHSNSHQPIPTPLDPMFVANTRSDTVNNNNNTIQTKLYCWGGRMYHVPENFKFPDQCLLFNAFNMWLNGLPDLRSADGKITPVMPFRLMQPKCLPSGRIKDRFSQEFLPIMRKLLSTPNLPLDVNSTTIIPHDVVHSAFTVALDYLKTQVSYIFSNPKYKIAGWSVGTWSKRVSTSEIRKFGTDEDKAKLPEETAQNKKRKRRSS